MEALSARQKPIAVAAVTFTVLADAMTFLHRAALCGMLLAVVLVLGLAYRQG